LLVKHGLERGYDLAVISGTLRQAKLYRHLGFVPFGPVVGTGQALYQPMYLSLEALRRRGKAFPTLRALAPRTGAPLNFLPGPVAIHPDVAEAFCRAAVSHRSAGFARDFQTVGEALCRLARAARVQVLMGSGTLANEAVAAQLSLEPGPGLILSNGAFGERLIDHAARFGLRFQALRIPWGDAFEPSALDGALKESPTTRWLWAVHGETSTGVLNDLDLLKEVARARGLKLCLDAVSSLGATPIDLGGVAFASGVSGKGLAAFPGLALVFHGAPVVSASTLPRYLDLGHYAEHGGLPFTLSSNLLYALKAALDRFEGPAHFDRIESLAAQLREGLGSLGLTPVARRSAFAAVTTLELPASHHALDLGRRLEEAGYLVNYRSEHLVPRNWLQICLMGDCTSAQVAELLQALAGLFSP
jgi:aspartate aminotransferase-like enzyme